MEQARSTTQQDQVWRNGAFKAVVKSILNPRETEHNYKLYINSLKRYKTFEEQLKGESGRYVELLMSGSMAESLFATHWVYEDGRREAKNDIDIMLVDFSMKVVERKAVNSSVGFNDFAAVVHDNNHFSTAELSHPMDQKCYDQKDVPLLDTEMSATGSLQNGSGSERSSEEFAWNINGDSRESEDPTGDSTPGDSTDPGSLQNESGSERSAGDSEDSTGDSGDSEGCAGDSIAGDSNDYDDSTDGDSTNDDSADGDSTDPESLQNGSGNENNSGHSIDSAEKREYTQKDLFLETTDRPGYVQLRYEPQKEGKSAFLSTDNFKEFWREIVNKTALYSLVSGPQLPSGGVLATGPALNRRDRPNSRNNYAHDYVPCLQCPEWPSIANNWSERSRTMGWPSKDLISDILSKGCHVVPVSHHDSTSYNTEWRLSFSLAEKMLVNSLSKEQRQSYIVAKLIMKEVIQEIKNNAFLEKTPSSYHLKTILLWKCEEKKLEEWNNILNSAVELLESFVDHLLRGNIPNYFIPENNMVSHISHQGLVSVANGIAASLEDIPATLHRVFQTAYETVLDFDNDYFPVLRLVNCELEMFCQTGTAGNKLYLCYILNSLVDSLSAAIIGTSDELQHLDDHKHILKIYCTHQIAAGNPLTLPSPPVLGAAEQSTTVMLLFQYLYTLLQDDHILTQLQNDIFAILSRIFTRILPVISLNLSEEMFCDCCEESLRVYQRVCTKLKIELSSYRSCHEELIALRGLDFIFFKCNELAEMEAFEFAAKRFQKFKEDGQIEKAKSLEW
ncbi:uncharacterized protein LOC116287425 [Actinia tenebrosa]|uniref:Uncharacterized protein LOC116287425 n=1 Tax=Actinia tenebrosa TaxID=6105 RepID=A0A6P8HBT9_ACTTE|nr:uncharacterized protein LOC116287425 [Actinia tenebrosa]